MAMKTSKLVKIHDVNVDRDYVQWYLFYAGAAEMLAQAAQTIKLHQAGGEMSKNHK